MGFPFSPAGHTVDPEITSWIDALVGTQMPGRLRGATGPRTGRSCSFSLVTCVNAPYGYGRSSRMTSFWTGRTSSVAWVWLLGFTFGEIFEA